MILRTYQQAAVDAAIAYIKKSFEPCLIEAATGAGKSLIISEVARWVNNRSGKKVLCLAPSKELVKQNHSKYLATGNPASIYCASINKSLAHDVVFGSPQTVKNDLVKFGDNFACIIIDEAQGITPTVRDIVSDIKRKNNKCRVIGLTATPYRTKTGYIYQYDENDKAVLEDQTIDPYFNKMVYRITAHELIGMGYLTPPNCELEHAESYDTSNIKNHTAREYEQVFEGKGRLTSMIVADVVEKSQNRMGIMFFCATIQHAYETLESLPPNNSRIITGKTTKKDREQILEDFQHMRFKYLVNVDILTTGFDAPHVDGIAILRSTESAGLLQQIIGRGLRLHKNKNDCAVWDYAGNLENHCPDGDVFNPTIKVFKSKSESFTIEAVCPECNTINEFAGRNNPDGFDHDENGYFVDLAGSRIMTDDDQPMPAHHGRRCYGQSIIKGHADRCEYRWTFKQCDCGHENDIAARYCESCKEELIDPNEKLKLEFTKMKSDPYSMTTDKVLSWRAQNWTSIKGNEMVKVDYTTEYRSFPIWYWPNKCDQWRSLCMAALGKEVDSVDEFMQIVDEFEAVMPKTITVAKNRKSKFYECFGHNKQEDLLNEIP